MGDSNTITPMVRIAFADCHVTVASDIPSVLEALAGRFALMLASDDPSATSRATMTVRPMAAGFRIEEDALVATVGPGLEALMAFLEQQIRVRFMEAKPALHWLHAGAVERQGRAVVLPGATLRGKSTLVAVLCSRGWRYLSDEAAPIDLDAGEVFPFPQTLAMRVSPGVKLDAGAAARLGKREVRFADAEVSRGPALLQAIVFPEYDGHSKAQLIPFSAGSALHELIRTSINFRDQATTTLPRLGALVGRVPSYRLAYSDAADAANAIDNALGSAMQ